MKLPRLLPDLNDAMAVGGLAMIGGGLYLAVDAWLALIVVGVIVFWGGVRPTGRQ